MSHPPRRFWEDNYQARDVPDPEAGGEMSSEGQTIRKAIRRDGQTFGWPASEIHKALEAVATLEDRLAEAERALREIVMAEPDDSGPQIPWPSFAGHLQNLAALALPSESGTA